FIKMRSGYQERYSGCSQDSERDAQDVLKIPRGGSASMLGRQTSLLGKGHAVAGGSGSVQQGIARQMPLLQKRGGLSSDQAGSSRLMIIR
ncbi:MAG: hypothetical protein ACXVCM_07085, partial [Ktedonobacteraceae bacterium]